MLEKYSPNSMAVFQWPYFHFIEIKEKCPTFDFLLQQKVKWCSQFSLEGLACPDLIALLYIQQMLDSEPEYGGQWLAVHIFLLT